MCMGITKLPVGKLGSALTFLCGFSVRLKVLVRNIDFSHPSIFSYSFDR